MRHALCASLVVGCFLLLSLPIPASSSATASQAAASIHERVSAVLQSGRRLSPEALLAAAHPAAPASAAAGRSLLAQHIAVASVAGTAAGSKHDEVSISSAQDKHIKWILKQAAEMTLAEEEDDDEQPAARIVKESASLLRRRVAAGGAAASPNKHPGTTEAVEENLVVLVDDGAGGSSSSGSADDSKTAEMIKRLTKVDWNAVLEQAHQEAKAAERQRKGSPAYSSTRQSYSSSKRSVVEYAEGAESEYAAGKKRSEDSSSYGSGKESESEEYESKERDSSSSYGSRPKSSEPESEEDSQYYSSSRSKQYESLSEGYGGSSGSSRREEKEEPYSSGSRSKSDGHNDDDDEEEKESRYISKRPSSKEEGEESEESGSYSKKGSDSYGKDDSSDGYKPREQEDKEEGPDSKDSSKDSSSEGYEKKQEKEEPSYTYYEGDEDKPNRLKVVLKEKSRSTLRYFPGGGIYSFTSELTCANSDEAYASKKEQTFPMVSERMSRVTVGVCEWTVAEVSPTQVSKNSFLLGNAWTTCTFLPICAKQCGVPISGGLTLTMQALMYQFVHPQGIREQYAEVGSAASPVATAAIDTPHAADAAASSSSAASAASTSAAAATKSSSSSSAASAASSKKYLMDVELNNAFLGLVTGAWGPKKASQYKQGALQFSFGAPPDTEGKSYAIETRLPPVQLGGPSVEELQDGMVHMVPGTYSFVFDQE